jgi:hypothetical protein
MNSRGEVVSILVLVKSKTLWVGRIGNKTGVLGGWLGGCSLEAKWFSSSKSLKHCRMRNKKPKWSTRVRNTKSLELFTREEQQESSAAAAAAARERERERERVGGGERQESERERKQGRETSVRAKGATNVPCTTNVEARTNERTNEFRSSSSPNASFHYCVHIFSSNKHIIGVVACLS